MTDCTKVIPAPVTKNGTIILFETLNLFKSSSAAIAAKNIDIVILISKNISLILKSTSL